jgi:spoIIIJ-associated protein
MTSPINDTDYTEKKIAGYLKVLTSRSGLNLEFRILVTTEAPDREDDGIRAATHPSIAVEFYGPDTPLLLARNGELLHSIEHIAAKILGLEPEDHDRISFDAEGFKANRDRELARSAEVAIEQVRETGQPYSFPPMTSRERRMLHLILTKSGLPTASSGEGPRRFVVLYPEGSSIPVQLSPGSITNGPDRSSGNSADRTQAIRNRFRRR